MLARCLNPSTPGYERYGGRGIAVCERWRESFQNFLADMGPRPLGTTLDRINNDGNYEPGNCRWATSEQQAGNTSKTRWVDGMSLAAAARKHGIQEDVLRLRLKRGWDEHRALATPLLEEFSHPRRRAQ